MPRREQVYNNLKVKERGDNVSAIINEKTEFGLSWRSSLEIATDMDQGDYPRGSITMSANLCLTIYFRRSSQK